MMTESHANIVMALGNGNMSKREKYFICPNCGDVKTRTELNRESTAGGYGMCDCKQNNGVYVQYEEIKKPEYEARLKEMGAKK